MSYLDHASTFGESPRRPANHALHCKVCGRPPHLIGPHPTVMLYITAKTFDMSLAELTSHARWMRLVRARCFYVWAMRSLGAPRSYPKIGRDLGGFHHTSIMNLHLKAIRLRLEDEHFAALCDAQEQKFYQAREHTHGNA